MQFNANQISSDVLRIDTLLRAIVENNDIF